MSRQHFRSACPIATSLDVIGDKWSLLIIRDMLVQHKTTFKGMSESDEAIAPSILSARLKLLENYKLITKRKLPTNQKTNIYLLTDKAIAFAPIMVELSLWGDEHLSEFNHIDSIAGLKDDKSTVIRAVQQRYRTMREAIMAY